METAGRAVVFSGITVAIGLLALVALPLPFLRSMGYGGMLIPLVSVLVAITLLPSCSRSSAPRLDWPHRRTDDKASRAWTRWAECVVAPPLARGRRRRGASCSRARRSPPRTCSSAASDADTIAKAGDAKHGPRRRSSARASARARCCRTRCSSTAAPTRRRSPRAVARRRRHPRRGRARRADVARAAARRSSRRSRSPTAARRERPRHARRACATPRTPPGPTCASAAARRRTQDFIDAVYGNFPLMIALIAIITFILLARAFRSLLLPLKAVVLNVAQRRRRLGRARCSSGSTATARRRSGASRRPARSRPGCR